MREFMLLYIGGEWRFCRILTGLPDYYTVIDLDTKRSNHIEKWRVWQAATGPRLTTRIAA